MPTSIPQNQLPFYDLKTFFTKKTNDLSSKHRKVKKSIVFDGNIETKLLDSLNYHDELSIFINSDINKLSWADKYSIDSLVSDNGQLQTLKYTAKNENLKTKSVQVSFDGVEEVSKIEIHNLADGLVSRSEQFLTYDVNIGYQIKNIQKVSLTEEKELLITVEFQ